MTPSFNQLCRKSPQIGEKHTCDVKKEWRILTKISPKDMIIYQTYHFESAS